MIFSTTLRSCQVRTVKKLPESIKHDKKIPTTVYRMTLMHGAGLIHGCVSCVYVPYSKSTFQAFPSRLNVKVSHFFLRPGKQITYACSMLYEDVLLSLPWEIQSSFCDKRRRTTVHTYVCTYIRTHTSTMSFAEACTREANRIVPSVESSPRTIFSFFLTNRVLVTLLAFRPFLFLPPPPQKKSPSSGPLCCRPNRWRSVVFRMDRR